jgi:hypothetical protein
LRSGHYFAGGALSLVAFSEALCDAAFFLLACLCFFVLLWAFGAESLLAAGAGVFSGAAAGVCAVAESDTAKALAISANINLFIMIL